MSNTSYSFKENSHVIVNQGGEKKVMKKILSVALSTAMAFSMFASVAFGADAKLTPEQQFNALKEAGIVSGFPDGLSHLERTLTRAELAKIIVNSLSLEPVDATSYNDKNYANHWGRPYIEAATQAGILNGKDAVKKLFDPNGAVTVQELAKVLVTALKLEVPADANNTASAWAKGYVAAAVNAGYLADGINYQAQATRSQAVVAAYAIYEAAQVPTVKSYKVVDSKNVEFTLSNGEVVKVALEKELVAGKNEVKFTHNGHEYTASVEYTVTEATKVESVSADNLKEIKVVFDGKVDKETAENEANYKLNRVIEDAVLSEDGKTVVLTLAKEFKSEGNNLENQKETKLTVDGVKSSDKSKTIKQEVTFTPVDVTTPSVKEVVGLGTKAYKVVFSEPVDRADVVKSSNYKVDGKAITAFIDYVDSKTVVVNTELELGTHKLVVSDVQDFSGLKVVPLETEFTVAEDKEAPSIVSATGGDFTKVTIKFNEPVKSIGKVYNTVSSKGSKTPISWTKGSDEITVEFDKANALSLGENNIVIEGVTDYSNNSATREVKVSPTADAERPEVKGASEEANASGNSVVTIEFNENVASNAGATANFTFRDKDGKVVVGKGLDANGHPIVAGTVDGKKVKFTLAGRLDNGDYTIDITGVQDTAYVPNTILPTSVGFSVNKTATFEAKKFWVEVQSGTSAKRDVYFYVTFSRPVATEGNGSALTAAKYNYSTDNGTTYKALPTDSTVELITPETVKITVPYTADHAIIGGANKLRVSLIADKDGSYAYENNAYIGEIAVTSAHVVGATDVKALDKNTVEVKFDGKLVNIDAREFGVKSTVTSDVYDVSLAGYKYDGNDTIATFKVSKDLAYGVGTATLDADFISRTAGTNTQAPTANTQDVFGFKVDTTATSPIKDGIKPVIVEVDGKKFTVVAGTGTNEYVATLTFSENVVVAADSSVFTVTVNGADATNISYTQSAPNQVQVTFTSPIALTSGSYVGIALSDSNEGAKVIKDNAGNAVAGVTVYEVQ
ncbi:Ig-like domain-containing protein [Paenibacillus sp. p3-SID1389]|uniref:Ig-like domain-containing protein n=1 Tax=Paenibacillus sp. p3-SID1389 TaxID=2916364 RepID=UPI0021A4FC01|nr:Ig-like domain-containing protein [Paenibacillus sp. p3-SID1389]MCT2197077.1 Ig-like domain-containing protein [Paenibacillus sp. p3-SID1389]